MRLKELSIIQYQNVSRHSDLHRLWLPQGALRAQLDHFAKNPFTLLSMDHTLDFMERKKKIKGTRPISLTFDNGFLDFYESVFPLLSDYGYPATVLISPLRVGTKMSIGSHGVHFLDWSHLKELINHNITVGAFEDDAWNINQIPAEKVETHITQYKELMEQKLGVEVGYFGVKEGVPDERLRDRLIAAGYRAFLTECPTNQKPDPYAIGRIQVDDEDFNIFLTKISKTYLLFKDRKSWKYIREYSLDKAAHRLSEAYDRFRGVRTH
ncbi:polysaccharide deacetylase family protein [Thermodesulfobacteriota bacterium]